jgi:hypothetical protein
MLQAFYRAVLLRTINQRPGGLALQARPWTERSEGSGSGVQPPGKQAPEAQINLFSPTIHTRKMTKGTENNGETLCRQSAGTVEIQSLFILLNLASPVNGIVSLGNKWLN